MKTFNLLVLLSFCFLNHLAQAATGLQPVVILSLNAEGAVIDVQTRIISSAREGDAVSLANGVWVAQDNLDLRREQEFVRLTEQEIRSGQSELQVNAHQRHRGTARRILLIPERAPAREMLGAFVAYSPSNMIGYVQAVETNQTWKARSEFGEYLVVGFPVNTGPRRYEVLSGAGISRQIITVRAGENIAERVASAGKVLVDFNSRSRSQVRANEIKVGSFGGMNSNQAQRILERSAALRGHFLARSCLRALEQ